MTKNMYTVAGDGPCNEELALRIQAGDKNAAERLVSQNEGYLTELARAYTPWCEMEDLKQEAALALLDAAERFDPAYGTKLLTYATPAMEAALSDYASRYAFPLSVPTSRGSQLRTVAHLCAEAQDASESELTKAVSLIPTAVKSEIGTMPDNSRVELKKTRFVQWECSKRCPIVWTLPIRKSAYFYRCRADKYS